MCGRLSAVFLAWLIAVSQFWPASGGPATSIATACRCVRRKHEAFRPAQCVLGHHLSMTLPPERAGAPLLVKERELPFSFFPMMRTNRRWGLHSMLYAAEPWAVILPAPCGTPLPRTRYPRLKHESLLVRSTRQGVLQRCREGGSNRDPAAAVLLLVSESRESNRRLSRPSQDGWKGRPRYLRSSFVWILAEHRSGGGAAHRRYAKCVR